MCSVVKIVGNAAAAADAGAGAAAIVPLSLASLLAILAWCRCTVRTA